MNRQLCVVVQATSIALVLCGLTPEGCTPLALTIFPAQWVAALVVWVGCSHTQSGQGRAVAASSGGSGECSRGACAQGEGGQAGRCWVGGCSETPCAGPSLLFYRALLVPFVVDIVMQGPFLSPLLYYRAPLVLLCAAGSWGVCSSQHIIICRTPWGAGFA
jgi:hypothetical protein